jgi:hypothetical protein
VYRSLAASGQLNPSVVGALHQQVHADQSHVVQSVSYGFAASFVSMEGNDMAVFSQ